TQPEVQGQLPRCFPIVLEIRRYPRFTEKPRIIELAGEVAGEYADGALQELKQTIEVVRAGTTETRRVVWMKAIERDAEFQAVRAARPHQVVGCAEAAGLDSRRENAARADAGKAGDSNGTILNAEPRVELQRVRSIGRGRVGLRV